LKIVKQTHLNEKSPDFDEIFYTTAEVQRDDSPLTKYQLINQFYLLGKSIM